MNLERMLRFLNDRKLVFTVTSGRSGTKLLATLLGESPGTHAEHEPTPRFDWWGDIGLQPDRSIFDRIVSVDQNPRRVHAPNGEDRPLLADLDLEQAEVDRAVRPSADREPH